MSERKYNFVTKHNARQFDSNFAYWNGHAEIIWVSTRVARSRADSRTAQTRSMNFQQLPTISIDDIAIFDDEHNTDMCAGYLNKKASKQRLIEIGFISSSLFVMCITWK